MTPPLSLLLALTWLSGASAFTPGTEHDYEVTGSVNVPGHGVFSFKMAVGLSVLPVEGDMTPLARSADPLSHPAATRCGRRTSCAGGSSSGSSGPLVWFSST